MGIPMHGVPFMAFSITFLLILGFCHCSDKSVEVVGTAECIDCTTKNIKTQAFKGIRVIISCKGLDEKLKTKGVSRLDEEGNFKVILPNEFVTRDGQLKEECFAQLQTASSRPCPTSSGLEASKIILKSNDNKKITFTPSGKLAFSQATCTPALTPSRLNRGNGPIYCLHSGSCPPSNV